MVATPAIQPKPQPPQPASNENNNNNNNNNNNSTILIESSVAIIHDPLRDILAGIPSSVDTLDLSKHIATLTEKQITHIVAYTSHNIRTLIIKNWIEIVKPMLLRTLGMYLGPHLIHLDLSGSHIQDIHLETITTHLSKVQTICLQGCPLITSKGIRPVAAACNTTLTSLDMSHSRKVSSECLQWVAGSIGDVSCGKLLSFDASYCPLVGDPGVASLGISTGIGGGCPASLQFVNLSYCTKITDGGASAMCRKLRWLRVLRLEGLCRVGDKTLVAIGSGCPLLRSLNVSRCGEITDKGLMAIARGCHRLQNLNVAGAKRMTEYGLCSLAQKCGGLQVLNVTGCENITHNGLQALIQGLNYVREAHTFFGFVPKDTALKEKLQDMEYRLQEDAAILMQNGVLRRVYRRWGRQFLYRLYMSKCATIIQRGYRKYSRRLIFATRIHEAKCIKSAITIQRVYRGSVVRKLAAKEIFRRQEYARLQAYAIPIQTLFRAFIVRKKVSYATLISDIPWLPANS